MQRLPVTLGAVGLCAGIDPAVRTASGIVAALRQNTWVDQVAMVFAMIGISVPNFYLGLLMIILFAVQLRWLPTGGYIPLTADPIGWLATSTMPAISLALLLTGLLARITRSTMLEVLRQDYIRTARAKGLPQRRVVLKHALTNALIPITTVIGIIVSLLISGSVVTETLFSIPGIGQLLTQAVLNRDYPMVQGGLLITTALLVLINIGVDVLLRAARSARALLRRPGRRSLGVRAAAAASSPVRPWRCAVRHHPSGGGPRAGHRAAGSQ